MKTGAQEIIQLINEYHELRPVQTRDILVAISKKINESVKLADDMGNTRAMYESEREKAIIDCAIESLNDHLELMS